MHRYRLTPKFYLLVGLGMALFFFGSFCVSRARLNSELDALAETQSRKAALSAEVTELKEELQYADTPEYIERRARDKLGMLYPGEIRYVGSGR